MCHHHHHHHHYQHHHHSPEQYSTWCAWNYPHNGNEFARKSVVFVWQCEILFIDHKSSLPLPQLMSAADVPSRFAHAMCMCTWSSAMDTAPRPRMVQWDRRIVWPTAANATLQNTWTMKWFSRWTFGVRMPFAFGCCYSSAAFVVCICIWLKQYYCFCFANVCAISTILVFKWM